MVKFLTRSNLLFAAVATLLANGWPIAGVCQTAGAPERTPVIVELFTSEGCSSCPPADAILASLDRSQPIPGAEVLALEEHVDYWNQDGWHDRFSDELYTSRQKTYGDRFHIAEIYTPQVIVDGVKQLNGTDGASIQRAVDDARRQPHLTLALTPAVLQDRKIHVSVSLASTATEKLDKHADLFAVLVQPSATTDVHAGENNGHTLHHAAVTRAFTRVGSLEDLSRAPKSFTLTAPKDAVLTGYRVVVFAQSAGLGPILGSGSETIGTP
jgi:hypothetical protein